MEVIKISNVSKEVMGSELFHIEQLGLNQGERIGLIGENGVGKSTLIKMIVGHDANYKGRITAKDRLAYVPQIKASSPESGGQQTKRMLLEALDQNAEILILDEPSSHLDQVNIKWLTQALDSYRGSIILVSHDRHLLNQVVTHIWELDKGKVEVYKGNYDDYLEKKKQAHDRHLIAYKNYQETYKRLAQQVQQRKANAQTITKKKKNVSTSDYRVNSMVGSYDGQQKSMAKSALALQKRLERMDKVEPPQKDKPYRFLPVGKLSDRQKTLINLEAGQVKVKNRLLFSYTEFKVSSGDKIGLQGPNQAGKTSFLKQVFDQSLKGYYAKDLSVGYFSQNFDNLDLQATVFDNVQKSSLQPLYLMRTVLASLGFSEDKLDQPIHHLSGGERVRLSFAKVILGDHQLLILDEPNNFLDIRTLQSVEQFIKDHPAAIILVSHDQAFLNNAVDKSLYIKNNRLVKEASKATFRDHRQNEMALLSFQLSQLMADPNASLDQVREVKQALDSLKKT